MCRLMWSAVEVVVLKIVPTVDLSTCLHVRLKIVALYPRDLVMIAPFLATSGVRDRSEMQSGGVRVKHKQLFPNK